MASKVTIAGLVRSHGEIVNINQTFTEKKKAMRQE